MTDHSTDTASPAARPPLPRIADVREVVAHVFLDHSDQAFYVLDRAWRFVYLNEQAERLVQRTRDGLLGRVVWDEFPAARGTLLQDAYERAFASGAPVTFENYYPPLETWFEVQAYPRDGLLVVGFREINRRKAAQVALHGSEERFELAAEATTDVLWDYEFAEDRLWWSENLTHLFGYAPAEAGSTLASWSDRIHPDDRERALAAVETALEARAPRVSAEYRFRAKDSTYRPVLHRMRFLYDEEGRPRRGVGMLFDLTDQKAAEERQRFLVRVREVMAATMDYHHRLRELARACCGPLCDYCVIDVIEEDGLVHRIEAAHADPAREELVRELLRFPPVQEREGGVPMALRTGEPVVREEVDDAELRRIAQTPEHLEILRALGPRAYMVLPLRAREQTLGAIVLTLTTPGRRFTPEDTQLAGDLARQAGVDIHNARLHRDVERARRVAEEASQAKGQFLAMMSHELRTPLTVLIGFAELMESGASGPVTERQKERIRQMKASAWHLVAMVDEVLAYSRMEAGAEEARMEPADVVRITRDVAHLLVPHAQIAGLEIRCSTPEEPVVLRTDPGKVRQVLTNLVGNALKFTEVGAVEIELRRRDAWVEVEVRDTGPGIPPEDHERIFEAFWQAEETDTRSHGGTGLGLAISRRFARMVGGDVEVRSEPGRGSTFTLRLPASGGG